MRKNFGVFLVIAVLVLSTFCLSGCGSSSKTQKLLSSIDFEKGYHLATETVVDGKRVAVDMYQRGDDLSIDAETSYGDFIFLYVDGVFTILDPSQMKGEVTELSEELAMQLAVFSSNGDLMMSLAKEDREFTKSKTKIEGVEYYSEETELSEDSIIKFLYNDDDDLAYMVKESSELESVIKIKALDGDVSDENFKVPSGYKVTGSTGTGGTSSSSGLTEVVNTAGGYSFMTSKMNRVNKIDERTMVYTNSSGDIPYFNVFIMDKGSTQNVDSLLDAGIDQAWEKYQNRLPGSPVKKTQNFNGYSAKGIEYSYSTVDGTDMVEVQHYYIGMGDKWISFMGEFYSGDGVSQAEMFEAMSTVKLK